MDRDAAHPPRLPGLLSLCVAAPSLVLAVAAIAGLGLARGVSAPLAFLAALALTLTPIAGLAARWPTGGLAWTTACWIWCVLLLVGVPLYFPGERADATARGLQAVTAFAGERASDAAGELGRSAVGLLGSDPRPATPSAPESIAGRRIAPRATPSLAAANTDGPAETVILPYEGEQTSLRVQVDIDGPDVGEAFEMIFDTGATFTTIDRESLRRLGVDVPRDAPWITLRTASGPIEAPLVLVDAIWLGDEPVEWVTVAVCDSCSNPPAIGLLGLNVAQRFRVSLDHDRRHIELRPRQSGSASFDRGLDIAQWLEIRSAATQHWTGAVDVSLTAANVSRRPIERAVIDLQCGEDTFAVQLDDIPAAGERTTEIALPRGTDCRRQSVSIARGHWLLDRF